MKPESIIIGLKALSWILIPVILIGIFLALDSFEKQKTSNLLSLAFIICIFIFLPTALLFLCAGMSHLLKDLISRNKKETLSPTQFKHNEDLEFFGPEGNENVAGPHA